MFLTSVDDVLGEMDIEWIRQVQHASLTIQSRTQKDPKVEEYLFPGFHDKAVAVSVMNGGGYQ